MPAKAAFLSYTRTDDRFFGGYITAFRQTLENAIQVVTGDLDFKVFQDIEGLVIGDNWEKRLAEVITHSSFFIPMLSPLFFNSKPCQKEIYQFLDHERALKRDDLILPIYFISSPKIDKEEEKMKDPLATLLAQRQIYDWREQALIPLQDPASRPAILTLARAIETALQRLENGPRGSAFVGESSTAFVDDDADLNRGVAVDARRQQLEPLTILWVDDNPDNNVWERKALSGYGIRFVLATDTEQAETILKQRCQDISAVISDVSRLGDSQAGFTLLSRVRAAKLDIPYFIYTAGPTARLSALAGVCGAQGLTADPDDLIEHVVAAIR